MNITATYIRGLKLIVVSLISNYTNIIIVTLQYGVITQRIILNNSLTVCTQTILDSDVLYSIILCSQGWRTVLKSEGGGGGGGGASHVEWL